MLLAMDLPTPVEQLMLVVLKSFSAKICVLPVSMQRKVMEDYY